MADTKAVGVCNKLGKVTSYIDSLATARSAKQIAGIRSVQPGRRERANNTAARQLATAADCAVDFKNARCNLPSASGDGAPAQSGPRIRCENRLMTATKPKRSKLTAPAIASTTASRRRNFGLLNANSRPTAAATAKRNRK